ncbi:MAG TPA: hypothetical protein VKD90_24435, partial [Gemmataceae bacterium]|nr:hypothetical protein [Gemmataceae bacterium]
MHAEPAVVPGELRDWLDQAVRGGASDLHLTVGYPPTLRLHGDLTELAEPPLTGESADALLAALCPADDRGRLRSHKEADFSFEASAGGRPTRFRAHLFHAAGHLGACLRVVPAGIPEFDWAGFPVELAERLAYLRDGLVILTGPTGSGKTTTLAMV